jgi:hypothetical protein
MTAAVASVSAPQLTQWLQRRLAETKFGKGKARPKAHRHADDGDRQQGRDPVGERQHAAMDGDAWRQQQDGKTGKRREAAPSS